MAVTAISKIEGALWLAGGVMICGLAWRADVGSFREPGPGFVPLVSGLLVSIVGAIMSVSGTVSRRLPGQDRRPALPGIAWSRLGYTMALAFGYALLLDHLGYLLTASLTMWGLFYDRGRNHWAVSLLLAVLAAGSSYVVFDVWLRSQLPRGVFGWR